MAGTKSGASDVVNQYAFLSQIKDPHLRRVIKMILDQTGNLNGQATDIGRVTQPLDTHMDANGNKVQNLADPVAQQDAVTKAYLDKAISQLMATFAEPKA